MPRDNVAISPVPFVRDLGIYVDADPTMRTRVHMFNERCRVASPLSISYVRSADRYLQPRFKRWWSHRGAFLAGLRQQCTGQYSSMSDARRLQLVLNAAAHVIFNVKPSDISNALIAYISYGSRSA